MKAVIFDLGGVLIPAPMDFWKEFEQREHLKPNSILETLLSADVYPHFQSFERGQLSAEDFDPIFTHIYNLRHSRTCGKIIPVFRMVCESMPNLRIHKDMVRVLKTLRNNGYRLILITNNFWLDRAHRQPTLPPDVAHQFDDVLESCRLGMRKPDRAIYELACTRNHIRAEDCVFLDDLGKNLKSAKQLGMRTIKVQSVSQAIRELSELLGIGFSFPPETRECIERERLKVEPLEALMKTKIEVIRKFRHGQSNPTYYLRTANGSEYVLRKKPSGDLLPKAHQIEREFRIIRSLQGLLPLPKAILIDERTLDTPFYVMEYQKGRIFINPSLPELNASDRRQVYVESIKTLARIHSIDVEKNGLKDFGRSDGYMKRNLKRWHDAYNLSKTEEIEAMDKLGDYLQSNLPEDQRATIVHGDYRIDNLIMDEREIIVSGILDWELSTIGDPYSDLATFLFIYYVPSGMRLMPGLADYGESELKKLGIPTIDECLDLYSKYSGMPRLSKRQWTFYMGFVIYRFAAILQGVYMRSLMKNASSTDASKLGPLVRKLASDGCMLVQQNETAKLYGNLPVVTSAMSEKATKLFQIVGKIVHEDIIPMEKEIALYYHEHPDRWTKPFEKLERIKQKAKDMGAWNLFISDHIDPERKYGKGLTNVEYAHICELMGRCIFAPEVFNCQAPDTGNMEVLIKYGSEDQKQRWLLPLLEGKIKSCFAMTEPEIASSDANNIQGSIVRVGDEYIINARKWFTSNAAHPNCQICIFMGQVAGEKKSRLFKQSMILVPMNTTGVEIVRKPHVFGSQDAPGSHPEILFTNVRVPLENMIMGEGRGFEIAQGRLGPGRIHHAMRLIGHAERSIDVMKERMESRVAFGKKLSRFDGLRKEIAWCRCEVEQARLLVLKAAHMIDTVGVKEARAEIAMIKVVAPNMAIKVIERAMQQQGARGFTEDTPLAMFYVAARSLRIADGPDEVHLETIAKIELKSRL